MVAYSLDLRTRVLKDSDAGMASKLVAEKYAVSRAWVDRLKQRRRETGEIAPRRQTRWRTPLLPQQCRLGAREQKKGSEICRERGYPFNRSCPTPLFSTGDSLEDAPGSAGADAPAAALAGLFEVDGWR